MYSIVAQQINSQSRKREPWPSNCWGSPWAHYFPGRKSWGSIDAWSLKPQQGKGSYMEETLRCPKFPLVDDFFGAWNSPGLFATRNDDRCYTLMSNRLRGFSGTVKTCQTHRQLRQWGSSLSCVFSPFTVSTSRAGFAWNSPVVSCWKQWFIMVEIINQQCPFGKNRGADDWYTIYHHYLLQKKG